MAFGNAYVRLGRTESAAAVPGGLNVFQFVFSCASFSPPPHRGSGRHHTTEVSGGTGRFVQQIDGHGPWGYAVAGVCVFGFSLPSIRHTAKIDFRSLQAKKSRDPGALSNRTRYRIAAYRRAAVRGDR